jgi:hypothetical protein
LKGPHFGGGLSPFKVDIEARNFADL